MSNAWASAATALGAAVALTLDEASGNFTNAASATPAVPSGGVLQGEAGLVPDSPASIKFTGSGQQVDTGITSTGMADYSVEFLIKTTDNTGILTHSRGVGPGASIGLGAAPAGGGINGGIYAGINGDNMWWGVSTDAPINDGNVHHVVITWDGASGADVDASQFKIYVDKVSVAVTARTYNNATAPFSNMGTWRLGLTGSAPPNTWIDAYAVYPNVVLTASDVTALNDALLPREGDVSIPARLLGGSLTNFVAKVNLAQMPANFWTTVDTGLTNLRVQDQFGYNLPFDLVHANHAAQTGEVFFKATLSTTASNWFRVRGVAGATAPLPNDPLGRNNVWTDYDAVIIAPDVIERKTASALIPVNTPPSGFTFAENGSYKFVGVPNRTTWTMAVSGTLASQQTKNNAYLSYSPNNGATTTASTILADYISGTTSRYGIYNSTDDWLHDTSVYTHTSSGPHRLVHTHNGTANRKIYRDGVLRATDTTVAQRPVGGDTLYLGSRGESLEHMKGTLNYAYLRNGELTAAWIDAEHRSWQADTLAAFTAPTVAPTLTATEPAVSSAVLRWSVNDAKISWHEVRVDGGAVTKVYGQDFYDFTGLLPNTAYTLEVRGANEFGATSWATSFITTLNAAYFDNFNRANSTNTIGSPQQGGPYTVRTGTWGISNNALYTSASTSEAHVTFPGLVDLNATIKLGAPGGNAGLLFRWVDVNNTWLFQITTTAIAFHRRTGGTWIQHGSIPIGGVAGKNYRVLAVGTRILAYVDNTLMLVAEDQHYPAATATMGYRFSSDTTSRFDEVVLYAATASSIPGYTGEAFDETCLADRTAVQSFIYKGRDSKVADEGAVA